MLRLLVLFLLHAAGDRRRNLADTIGDPMNEVINTTMPSAMMTKRFVFVPDLAHAGEFMEPGLCVIVCENLYDAHVGASRVRQLHPGSEVDFVGYRELECYTTFNTVTESATEAFERFGAEAQAVCAEKKKAEAEFSRLLREPFDPTPWQDAALLYLHRYLPTVLKVWQTMRRSAPRWRRGRWKAKS